MIKRIIFCSFLLFCICCKQDSFAEETQGGADIKNNPFGVLEFLHWNHNWNCYKYSCGLDLQKGARLIKEAGAGIVRMDFLWDEIEPKPGEFDFDKYDCIVDILEAEGIEILGILDYSAGWAAACQKWNCPPQENKHFVNYAAKIIRHYKGRIKYWELWNEPDSATYWSEQDGLKGYCALLKEVYTAAKKANPDCLILNGGLANGLSSVNILYDNGAKGYFDIMNVHFFADPLRKNAIKGATSFLKRVHNIMSRKGDGNKKIWLTEIGCPGVRRGKKVSGWWLGKNPTEAKQAEWVRLVYSELLKDKNVEKIFWAFFRDCKDHWSNGIDYFGLIRWNFSKKPSFKAYRDCFENWKKRK